LWSFGATDAALVTKRRIEMIVAELVRGIGEEATGVSLLPHSGSWTSNVNASVSILIGSPPHPHA
jgi:hypothetical protein